ncbi:MAG: TetR/AcrR family transcriptional regulator C-terminal domain-containing protein [Oscillospiraceae bacterium]|nr:TetR/AcrR family transcriptional regulator C-terminal domain-containing protein [Oscillospiraceae bacterium]
MSNVTKRVLAMSLKGLLAKRPLDAITIQDIVDDAGVSRKTFYYHFQDVYALLEWILVDEGKRILEGNITADTWQQGLRNVLAYFQNNRAMILNIHRSLQYNNDFFKVHVTELVQPLLEQIFEAQPRQELVPAEDKAFILRLYSFGLVALVLHWIGDGMKPDAEYLMEQLQRIFSGSMDYVIQKCLGS